MALVDTNLTECFRLFPDPPPLLDSICWARSSAGCPWWLLARTYFFCNEGLN